MVATQEKYFRKVIRITAEDSPNVKLALRQIALGRAPTHETLVPGVLTYAKYLTRKATWNPVRKCIGLDARFYKGGEVLLYPPDELAEAEKWGEALKGKKRIARALGCDPGEGGDPTAWCIVDEYGLIYLESRQTPDTSIIPGYTIHLMKKYSISPERVCFDRGGGGKEHADRLRSQGFRGVRSVGFGESIMADPKAMRLPAHERRITKEERGSYKNRRAQMYGELSILFNHRIDRGVAFLPNVTHLGCDAKIFLALRGFSLPTSGNSIEETLALQELQRQLSVIPRWTDEEGRMYLPRKQRKGEERYQQLFAGGQLSKQITLNDLLGRSPDEADSLVLAVHAMLHKGTMVMAGTF